MDLSLGVTRNKVSVEEYARRQSQELCFRCEGLSHPTRDCPTLPNRRKPLNASVAVAVIATDEPLVSDSEQSEK